MVEPVTDFSDDPDETVEAHYAETEGAVRYHLNRHCRGLKRAEGPIESTEVDLVKTSDGFELVSKGRNLCRICAPLDQ